MWEREKMEVDYARLFDHYNYGTTVWSPLAGGYLTGKYNDGVPEDSRVSTFKQDPFVQAAFNRYFKGPDSEKNIAGLKKLAEIAKSLGCTQAQLVMAWVIKYKNVSTAITSATKAEQLVDIVKAVPLQEKLTPEILKQMNELFPNAPGYTMNWKNWQTDVPPRRCP